MTDWDAPACTNRGCNNGIITLTGRGSVWIEVACGVCHGRGRMEARPPSVEPDPDRPRTPVGEHAAVRESGLCGQCLGARTILRGPQMVSEPCPSCTPHPR